MTIDEIMAAVDARANGRTRYEGIPDPWSEALVAEVRSLREQLEAAEAKLDEYAARDLLAELRDRHIPWSQKTFGGGRRTRGITAHIEKELREVEAAPDDVTEWIDVAILALDGAWRSGHAADGVIAALFAKLATIRTRSYPKPESEDVPSEHSRDPAGAILKAAEAAGKDGE